MTNAQTAKFSAIFAKLGLNPIDVSVVGGKMIVSFTDQGQANRLVSLCLARAPRSATIEAWDNEGTREFMVRCEIL